MGILRNLKIGEFSIVRGSDKQPANPEAIALFYKAQSKSKEKEVADNKQPAQPKKKSLAEQISDAVHSVFKGQTVRTSVSTYTSRSESTDTIDDGQMAAAGESAPTVVVVAEGVEKTDPAQPTAEPTASPAGQTQEVVKALEPLTKAILGIDSRLAKLENQSSGSQRLKSFPSVQMTDNSAVKFPEFTKFLASQAGLTPGQKLTKATLITSGWSYGLTITEANAFLDYLVEESVLLKQVRTVRMPGKKYRIDAIGLGGNVLKKGVAGTDPGDTVSLSGPTQIELSSEEVIAIVSIGDDMLEDNIEGDAFVQHLLGMIGRAAANEIEQAAIHGDTGVADAGIMDRWDGWLKLAAAGGAHVTDAMGDADRYWPGADGVKATKLIKSLPTKYRLDYRTLAFLLHNDLYLDYNDMLAGKGFSEAWMAITGVADVPLRSIRNIRVPLMKTDIAFTHNATPYTDGTVVMLTDLRNLIVGIQRDIKIEPQRQPRKRATDYVLSMRAAIQIENGDAIAIYDHAAVK
jgi:hypothetical protein